MTAPTETPSLTTEQALGLASRWAFWQAGLKQCADNAEFDREMAKAPMLLSAPEREQLFEWVRARCSAHIASVYQAEGGWPEDGITPDDALAMAADVSEALAWTDRESYKEALALCKAAIPDLICGWPS